MDIADAPYLSITTFRANGAEVANPVWISDQEDGAARLIGKGSGTDAGVVITPDSREV